MNLPAPRPRPSSPTPMTTMSRTAALTVLALALPAAASAQNLTEGWLKLGFNFNPPGARSAGLAGAFIGLADDATAAESNPAGLTVLLYPQVSAELKAFRYEPQAERFMFSDPQPGDFDRSRAATATSPAFVSGVLPTRIGTFALFRSQIVDYRSRLSYGSIPPDGGEDSFAYENVSDVHIRVANLGVAAAKRFNPRFSLGAAAGVSLLSLVQREQYVFAQHGNVPASPPATRGSGTISWTTDGLDANRAAPFVNLGAMLRFGEAFAAGAVYKLRRPFGGLVTVYEDQTLSEDLEPDSFRAEEPFSFDVPDAVGIGVSSRIGDTFTWSADAEYVMYSQLLRHIGERPGEGNYVDDGIDLRLGTEYVVVAGRTPVGLRAGIGRVAPSNLWSSTTPEYSWTGSAGFGAVLFRRWQLDAAVDVREARSSVTASLVYFLGRL